MSSSADASVVIQSSSLTLLCPPPWFGEIMLISTFLRKQRALSKICEQIRFAHPPGRRNSPGRAAAWTTAGRTTSQGQPTR